MAHSFGVIACLAVLVTLLGGASAQTTHVVLGTTGWVIPQTPNAYTDWAASQTFMIGDILMFNFMTGGHDVAEVSRASYDACTTTGVIGSIINNGPASLTLAAAGEHYYICAFPGHCGAGQKLMINVTGSSSTTPPMPSSPSPMPSTPMTPTPPMPSAPMPAPPMPSTPSPMPMTPMPTPPMPSTPSPSLSPMPMSPMPSPPMPSTPSPSPSLSPMPSSPMPTPPMPSTPSPMPSPPMSTPPMPSPPSPMMPSTPTGAPTPPTSPDSPNSASMVVSSSLVVIFLSIIVNMMM